MKTSARFLALAGTAALAACGGVLPDDEAEAGADVGPAAIAVARDTVLDVVIEAAGTAVPVQRAVLSTRLMGTVIEVLVREGQSVAAGALLLRIDARDLDARRAQVEAQQAEARAVRDEALTGARRMRLLFADSVATRAQLDAAETGLARAEAAVRLADAGAAEVAAAAAYAEVRAPFAGTVTRRLVDHGAFATPGAPLLEIEDASRLRITATAAPDAVRPLRPGARLEARIEGLPVSVTVEGVVPAAGGLTYEVNAIAANPDRRHLAHSAAVLLLPQGRRSAVVIPLAALDRDGELASVRVPSHGGVARRMVRTGRELGTLVEILSGLSAGDTVAVKTEPR